MFTQIERQHEPEKIFKELIGRNNLSKYVKEKKIKKICFYRDTILSSSKEFDKNGNLIIDIGMENSIIRKSIYKWNKENKLIEKKHFSTDGSFNNGYFYKYKDGAQLIYKIKDSLLFRKKLNVKDENISIYSEYNKNGKIIYKDIIVKDKDNNTLLESNFSNNRLSIQYLYQYINNKIYVTKVEFNKIGEKVFEKRKLYKVKTKNELKYFTADTERLFRIDSFDNKKRLLEMKLLDKENNQNKISYFEKYYYNKKGQLKKLLKNYLNKNYTIVYFYKYDKFCRLKKVIKKVNNKTKIFKYKYYTFNKE